MKTILTAGLTLGGCTAARWYLDRTNRRDTEYAGGHVRLTKLWNANGPFGLKLGRKPLLAASAAALGALWLCRKQAPVAVGFALGGGLSNLLERLQNRKVYDYIQFPKAPRKLKTYVFNLADFAVFSGMLGLLWSKK